MGKKKKYWESYSFSTSYVLPNRKGKKKKHQRGGNARDFLYDDKTGTEGKEKKEVGKIMSLERLLSRGRKENPGAPRYPGLWGKRLRPRGLRRGKEGEKGGNYQAVTVPRGNGKKKGGILGGISLDSKYFTVASLTVL